MAVRSAHHALILGHSDDAHAHLGGVVRNIPNPLLGQVRDTHMLIIILEVATLGADVVSELAIKIVVQFLLSIGSSHPLALGFILASSSHDENHSLIVGILIKASQYHCTLLRIAYSAQKLPFS